MLDACWPTEKNGYTRPTIGVAYAIPTMVAAITATPRTIFVLTFIDCPFDFGINDSHYASGKSLPYLSTATIIISPGAVERHGAARSAACTAVIARYAAAAKGM